MYLMYISNYIDIKSINLWMSLRGMNSSNTVQVSSSNELADKLAVGDYDVVIFDYQCDFELIDILRIMSDSLLSLKVFCKSTQTGMQYTCLTEDIHILPESLNIMTYLWDHLAFSLGNVVSAESYNEDIFSTKLRPIEGEDEGVLFGTEIEAKEDVDIIKIILMNIIPNLTSEDEEEYENEYEEDIETEEYEETDETEDNEETEEYKDYEDSNDNSENCIKDTEDITESDGNTSDNINSSGDLQENAESSTSNNNEDGESEETTLNVEDEIEEQVEESYRETDINGIVNTIINEREDSVCALVKSVRDDMLNISEDSKEDSNKDSKGDEDVNIRASFRYDELNNTEELISNDIEELGEASNSNLTPIERDDGESNSPTESLEETSSSDNDPLVVQAVRVFCKEDTTTDTDDTSTDPVDYDEEDSRGYATEALEDFGNKTTPEFSDTSTTPEFSNTQTTPEFSDTGIKRFKPSISVDGSVTPYVAPEDKSQEKVYYAPSYAPVTENDNSAFNDYADADDVDDSLKTEALEDFDDELVDDSVTNDVTDNVTDNNIGADSSDKELNDVEASNSQQSTITEVEVKPEKQVGFFGKLFRGKSKKAEDGQVVEYSKTIATMSEDYVDEGNMESSEGGDFEYHSSDYTVEEEGTKYKVTAKEKKLLEKQRKSAEKRLKKAQEKKLKEQQQSSNSSNQSKSASEKPVDAKVLKGLDDNTGTITSYKGANIVEKAVERKDTNLTSGKGKLSNLRKPKVVVNHSDPCKYFESLYSERDGLKECCDLYLESKANGEQVKIEDMMYNKGIITEDEYLLFYRDVLKRIVMTREELLHRDVILGEYSLEKCKELHMLELVSLNDNRSFCIAVDSTASLSIPTKLGRLHGTIDVIFTFDKYIMERLELNE